MPKATAKIRNVLVSTHHLYDTCSVPTVSPSLEMRGLRLRIRFNTESDVLLRCERRCFFTEVHGALGVYAEPEERAEQGQDCGDVQRAVPAETLGDQGGESRGDGTAQIPAHVHEPGHGAGVSLGEIDGGGP